jgi:hypothetical protein
MSGKVLDVLQRAVSGGLMAATAVGLVTLGYGIYSFSVLRPAALRAKAAADAARLEAGAPGRPPSPAAGSALA